MIVVDIERHEGYIFVGFYSKITLDIAILRWGYKKGVLVCQRKLINSCTFARLQLNIICFLVSTEVAFLSFKIRRERVFLGGESYL